VYWGEGISCGLLHFSEILPLHVLGSGLCGVAVAGSLRVGNPGRGLCCPPQFFFGRVYKTVVALFFRGPGGLKSASKAVPASFFSLRTAFFVVWFWLFALGAPLPSHAVELTGLAVEFLGPFSGLWLVPAQIFHVTRAPPSALVPLQGIRQN